MKRTIHWGARRLVALAMLTATLGGCQPQYESVSIHAVAGHALARASSAEISVPVGTLVVFDAELSAQTENDPYDAVDELRFESRDAEIARIVPGLRANTWIVMGGRVGTTSIEVIVNDEVEDTIDVEIVDQPEAP